ncbi:unnamed protein product [Mycena citricolor]|uniref:Myb/SANT-like domain-containing protein n=1 Tax=Mycena citricolor TaxID=2018698 RepID=A0AAD2H9S1_9AGAR|nr:unnamed protein product [Mycena citricolor]
MAWRIKLITKSKALGACVAFLAFLSLTGGVASSIGVAQSPDFSDFQHHQVPLTLWLTSTAFADLFITTFLVNFLWKHQTGFHTRTDSVADKIISFTVQTGLLTSFAAIADVTLFLIVPHTTLMFIWDFSLSKMYSICLLAALNARHEWNILLDRPRPQDLRDDKSGIIKIRKVNDLEGLQLYKPENFSQPAPISRPGAASTKSSATLVSNSRSAKQPHAARAYSHSAPPPPSSSSSRSRSGDPNPRSCSEAGGRGGDSRRARDDRRLPAPPSGRSRTESPPDTRSRGSQPRRIGTGENHSMAERLPPVNTVPAAAEPAPTPAPAAELAPAPAAAPAPAQRKKKKTTGPRCTWSDEDDEKLVQKLRELKDLGFQSDSGWKPGTWISCATVLQGGRGGEKTPDKVADHYTNIKGDFNRVRTIRNQSGFGWDANKQICTASEPVWSAYIARHPKASKWQSTPFPLYEDMLYLVDGIVATGEGAFHPGIPTITPADVVSSVIDNVLGKSWSQSQSQSQATDEYQENDGLAGNLSIETLVNDDLTPSSPVRLLQTPVCSAKRAASRSPQDTGRNRRRRNAEATADLAVALRNVTSSMVVVGSPEIRRQAISMMEDDNEFSDDKAVTIMKVFQRDSSVAQTYIASASKKRRTALIRSVVEDIDSRN